jgi:GWxTD domain-containing protein
MSMSCSLSSLRLLAIALVAIATSAGAVTSAGAQSRGGISGFTQRLPRLEIDVISLQSVTADSSRVDIYFAVPFGLLDFLYAGDKYVADYGAVIQVTDSATDRLALDRYQAYSVVEDQEHHELRLRRGIEMADAQQFSMNLKPGTYNVRIMLRDLSSHHTYDTVVTSHVRAFTSAQVTMSDPLVYRQKAGQRILPAIGGDVGTVQPQSSGVFALAYGIQDSSLMAVAAVTADNSEEPEILASNRPAWHSGIAAQPIFVPMDFTDLWMGSYDLTVYLVPRSFDTSGATSRRLASAAQASTSRQIHVSVLHGVPIAQADLEQAIEQLRTIATPSEWDSLTIASTPFEKRQAILDFWRKRDPDPYQPGNQPMEVFYRRIEYANTQFATGGTPGWKTDRGHVLIALGEPDYVDKHPYEANRKPYEVWEYMSVGTRFYFVDQYLLGDYRLSGAPPAPGTFVWDRP